MTNFVIVIGMSKKVEEKIRNIVREETANIFEIWTQVYNIKSEYKTKSIPRKDIILKVLKEIKT